MKVVKKGFRQGRPPKYNNCMDFAAMSEMYMEKCREEKKASGIYGWAVYLDMTMEMVWEYGEKPEFADIVKKYKQEIMSEKESMMLNGKGNTAGIIFWAKNVMGWSDRQETVNHTQITVTSLPDLIAIHANDTHTTTPSSIISKDIKVLE